MEILDKHFIKLPLKRKSFVIAVGMIFLVIALIAYTTKLTNVVESFLIMVVGMLYAEILKLSYRIETLEKKK